MTVYVALPTQAKTQLETALAHYRKAIAELNSAIESEAWGAVLTLQGSRDLQAHTIASIVNNHALNLVGEGVPA
ncbi:hypothetical protein D3C79_912360 [compost metagenome]